jgi:hypothetical protein
VNELERRYRRKVEKRGNDPHHSFTFMLCDVAMSRAHGTASFLLPDMAAAVALGRLLDFVIGGPSVLSMTTADGIDSASF